MEAANLAVIGAGPKAAALAARVAAIHAWRATHPMQARAVRPPPRLHIFERRERAGTHWFGGDGYTDGMQDVCTSEDSDLVFPARSCSATRSISRRSPGARSERRSEVFHRARPIVISRTTSPGRSTARSTWPAARSSSTSRRMSRSCAATARTG
jgi:hypothetical protein